MMNDIEYFNLECVSIAAIWPLTSRHYIFPSLAMLLLIFQRLDIIY